MIYRDVVKGIYFLDKEIIRYKAQVVQTQISNLQTLASLRYILISLS